MTQSMTTIAARIDPDDVNRARLALDLMGNPPVAALRARLDAVNASEDEGIHFVSMHAFHSFTPGIAHLVLEFSADGDADTAIAHLVQAIGDEIACLFALAPDWTGKDTAAYLKAHIIAVGVAPGERTGLCHSGSPGMTVRQILADQQLASTISGMLAAQSGDIGALDRLHMVRERLGMDSAGLARSDAPVPFASAGKFLAGIRTFGAFVLAYLWPFWLALAMWMAASAVWHSSGIEREPDSSQAALMGLWFGLRTGLPVLLGVLLLAVALIYARLLRLEGTDWVSPRPPDRKTLGQIVARENHYAQNHMISITELKQGWLRRFLLRLVFWAVAHLNPLLYRPGYLGPIGTIHFARWVVMPGTRDVVFMSNYGGSWQSYLEDFITLAHIGLTGVWSNTVGFPKTSNLVFGGASDGERFKRFARQSMMPTRFWYSAYPLLITDMIRANSEIRRGLSGAMTEDEADTWLAHFGSAIRPQDKLAFSEIQSLLFGGLSFLHESALTVWNLPPERAAARAWLAAIKDDIGWSDGRKFGRGKDKDAIVQLGLTPAGLELLGLPADSLETFPPAFLQGMTGPGRDRILGDTGANAIDNWWWGQDAGHVAVVIFAEDTRGLRRLTRKLAELAGRHGAVEVHRVDMKHYDRNSDNYEPFGFRDGISQPVMRGTYKGIKHSDPVNLVEPGEFIMGYPDNRGDLPPGARLDAIEDPRNVLPLKRGSGDFGQQTVNRHRDLGHNGSFLVIRQLEQDVRAFQDYCKAEADALNARQRLGPPYQIDADFIAAKLMGRWKNGSPMVRAAYSPGDADELVKHNTFLLGAEDPEGMRCPFGSHIRRANPRDSLNPGSMEQVSISNRHRIMRVGRKYKRRSDQQDGLLFMALAGDIERQFEFVQQTWLLGNIVSLNAPTTLSGESDPVIHGGPAQNNGFTIPSPDGPVKLSPMQRFVTMRGGGYYFLPGKRLVEYLSLP